MTIDLSITKSINEHERGEWLLSEYVTGYLVCWFSTFFFAALEFAILWFLLFPWVTPQVWSSVNCSCWYWSDLITFSWRNGWNLGIFPQFRIDPFTFFSSAFYLFWKLTFAVDANFTITYNQRNAVGISERYCRVLSAPAAVADRWPNRPIIRDAIHFNCKARTKCIYSSNSLTYQLCAYTALSNVCVYEQKMMK